MITIYTSTHCPYCEEAERYLDHKGLKYETKNIDLDESAYRGVIKKLNGNFRGTPVIDIDGQIIEGFDKSKINKAL